VSFRKRKGLVINEQCFFLTPASFSSFFNHHISVDSVISFNISHCYWLPPQLLESIIVKMKKVEDLAGSKALSCAPYVKWPKFFSPVP